MGSFQLKPQDAPYAALEVLAHLYARQEALIHFLMKKLTDNDEDFRASLDEFYRDYEAGKDAIVESIFEDYGHIDFDKLFGRRKESDDPPAPSEQK